MNKHTEIKNFIQQFLTDNQLHFEAVENYPMFRSIVPEVGDYQISTDILGNKKRIYTFAFVGIEMFDFGTSATNETNMQMFDNFSDWILQQEEEHNYPDFQADDYKWEVIENMANLATYDQSTQTAKYMLSCRLNYTERG